MMIMTLLMLLRTRRMKRRRSNLTELAPEADIHVVTPF